MRILCLSAYFKPEVVSSSHLTDDLFEAFSKNDMEVLCIVPQPTRGVTSSEHAHYKRKEEFYKGYVKVERFAMFGEKKNPFLRACRYFLCSLAQYCKGVKAKNIDVVYAASTPPTQGLLSALVARRMSKKRKCKVPFVYNLQDVFPDSLVNGNLIKERGILWKLGRMLENKTYKYADKIIVISNSMKENLINKNVPEKKIVVVSNWIDVDKVSPVLKKDNELYPKFKLSNEDFVVIYAGNLGEMQDAQIIIEAAKLLCNEEEIKFVILGGGSQFESIKKSSTSLKNVIVDKLLPLEYVSMVYSLGDVALITCKAGTGKAGLPSKTWSIMACNTPIIAAFDTDSELAKIIKESNVGICVEPGDYKALSEAILSQYKRKKNKSDIKAREYVINNASKEKCTNTYISVLKEMVKHSN